MNMQAKKKQQKQPAKRVKAGTSDGAKYANVRKPAPGRGGLRSTSGQGRPKGIPNKATANAREAIARFVDGNAERLQEWLDKIATEDGARAAFGCFSDLLEYHVPKLSRSELTGKDGVALPTSVNINVFGVEPRR